MSEHVFHPPTELVDHVITYAQGLVDHHDSYGDVPQNSPTDLADVVAKAKALEPKAKKIHDLELELAALKESYNKDAVPLWTGFSEKLGYAKVFAEKNKKSALLNFVRIFSHHTTRSAAATEPKK